MQKFTAGTPVREVITLRNMNEIADAVNRVNAFLPAAPRSAPDPFRSDIVRVSVSSKFPKFAAVTFSASLITSPVNSSDPIPTISAYQFAGEDPSAVTFGILQEPANPGEYARALISGVSFARLVVNDPGHQYAVLQSSDNPAFPGLLESAEAGPIRILAKSSDTLDGYPVAAVLLAAPATAASSGYRGYFTIEDASEEGEGGTVVPKVKVWDPRTADLSAAGGNQPCYVNGMGTTFGVWTSGALSEGRTWIRVHFTAGQPASGTVGSNDYVAATDPTVVIEAIQTGTPSDTDQNVYYQLGIVEIDESGKMTILQDHVTGIVRMWWFGQCA